MSRVTPSNSSTAGSSPRAKLSWLRARVLIPWLRTSDPPITAVSTTRKMVQPAPIRPPTVTSSQTSVKGTIRKAAKIMGNTRTPVV